MSEDNSHAGVEKADDGEIVTRTEENDPYQYVKGDEFTSEIYKLEIGNLPKKLSITKIRQRLKSLDLRLVKLKVPSGNFVFVTFRNEEDRNAAMVKLQNHVWKGNKLSVKYAKPAADPLLRKRKLLEDEGSSKKPHLEELDDDSLNDRLKDQVTPFWRYSYEEQLQRKTEDVRIFFGKLAKDLVREQPFQWVKDSKQKYGLLCELCSIVQSPVTEKYRNKTEFTIGTDSSGDKVVGFRASRYRDGSTVVEPSSISIIPDSHKLASKLLKEYLSSSAHDVFNMATNEGHWRQLTVRSTNSGLMLIVEVVTRGISSEDISKIKSSLTDFFQSGSGKELNVTSLYLNAIEQSSLSKSYNTAELLYSTGPLQETLLGRTFQISPDAFFQINSAASELLYARIVDWSELTRETTVLDICCGTGTIGITLAKEAKKVCGVEIVQQSIKDAKVNAELNDVMNAEWICGNAVEVVPLLMSTLRRPCSVVAVLDPPRDGVGADVIRSLRSAKTLDRLIYVSCSMKGARQNLLDLCRRESKRIRGAAFELVKAQPFDLFPQTPHCELLMLFLRGEALRAYRSTQEAAESSSELSKGESAERTETDK